jgi:hypothetical protein
MTPPGAIDGSQRKAARVAGLANLLARATVVVAQYRLFGPLVVRGDAAATARNILAHERAFRLSIAFDLLYVVGILVLVAALYVILKPVGPGLALLAAISRLVYALTWIALAMSLFAGVRLLGDSSSQSVFGAGGVPAIARLYFGRGFEAYYVGLPFYALASTVCSRLFLRSGYIPKALAFFGVISSAWCVACAFLYIVSPDFGRAVNPYWFDSPMALFEMAASVWLLFRGLRASGTPLRASAESSDS